MLFDRYLIVDWSASNTRKAGKDSIWVCMLDAEGHPSTQNPPTRRAAEDLVRGILRQVVDERERVLVGFDFPYAYPKGLAAALGLNGPTWLAIWEYLDERIEDSASNANNRFDVADRINSRLPSPAFWGCPHQQTFRNLSYKRDRVVYKGDGQADGLSEWREVESVLRNRRHHPQATWKLMGAGSVGSQTLTGLPVLARLRLDAVLADVSRVWPFEVRVPLLPESEPAIVHAEIWPSLRDIPAVDGQVKDESQVVFLAEEYRNLDRAGTLPGLFAAASLPAALEEGWILGVE